MIKKRDNRVRDGDPFWEGSLNKGSLLADSYCSNRRRKKKKSLISKLTKNFSVCNSVNNVYIK